MLKLLYKSPFNDNPGDVKPQLKQYREILKLFFSLNYLPGEYYLYRFYRKSCQEKDMLNFIPTTWFRNHINNQLTFASWESLFRNKLEFNTYARNKGLNVPIDHGVYNSVYGFATNTLSNLGNAAELKHFLIKNNHKRLLFKDLTGYQGLNIFFVTDVFEEDGVLKLVVDDEQITVEQFAEKLGPGEYLVQECLEGSGFMKSIYPHSINTIRIFTFYTKRNEVKIAGVSLKTGLGISRLDNFDHGGMHIPVNPETGCFYGFSYDTSYRIYEKHPYSQFSFSGAQIPDWPGIVAFIERCVRAFPMMRFVAWDVAHTSQGIYLIEGNVGKINLYPIQVGGEGVSKVMLGDLRELGIDFPTDKIPPVTLKKVFQRMNQVRKSFLGNG